MKNSEKQEFLDFAQDLARNLETVTDEFIEVQIGWMDEFQPSGHPMPVTIMINHESKYFGSFEKLGWNHNVIYNNLKEFTPVPEDYLALNELITKTYNGGKQ